jgi:Pyridoxamine 5'-phosphate oxidase
MPTLIPQAARAHLTAPSVFVLATASSEGVPATTLVSWICIVDDGRLLIALDRRGVAYENVRQNAIASLEVITPAFTGMLRGMMALIRSHVTTAPFACAAFVFEVDEVRNHGAPGVVVQPATYRFLERKSHYGARERQILAELRALAEDMLRAPHEDAME